MSCILYYSNYCEPSKKLIKTISGSKIKDDIHFLCIDNRITGKNNATYIVLENNQRVLLPPTVTKVPALLLLNNSHHVLFGEQIYNHLQPKQNVMNTEATMGNEEPQAYGLCQMNSISDSYSFWDQSSDELSAQGSGGIRQMHNYVGLDSNNNIETPPDSYEPDKIGNVSLEQLQEQRSSEIPQQIKKI
mgnify:CR=1 FL=1|tara:strand:- start:532 stop:1098 length:567 start_codon:yes stop_codon:yes gene_type:complete